MNVGIVFIADFIRAWASDGLSSERRDAIARQCGLACVRELAIRAQPKPEVLHTKIDDKDADAGHRSGIKVRRNIKFEDEGSPQSRSVLDRPRASAPLRPIETIT